MIRVSLKSSCRRLPRLAAANSTLPLGTPSYPTPQSLFSRLPKQFNPSFSTSTISSHDTTTDPKATACTDSLSTLRLSILKSALDHVHHHGWTDDALAAGAASVRKEIIINNNNNEISMSVVGMITVDDLIAFCMDQWNERLQQELQQQQQQQRQQRQQSNQRVEGATPAEEDLLEAGIKMRLQYLIPYLQSRTWHEGMALGLRGPSNALQTQRQLKQMIEIIVAAAEPALPLGVPPKMALGAVYVATELHLLTDTSPDYQDTWTFLSHRMDEWRRLTRSLDGISSSSDVVGSTSDVLFVASSVASSLLGGAVSLVLHPTNNHQASNKMASLGLPDAVWSSLFQSSSSSWGTATTTTTTNPASASRKEGTHPSDYDAKRS